MDDDRLSRRLTARLPRRLAAAYLIGFAAVPVAARAQSACRNADSLSSGIITEILRYTTATTANGGNYNVRVALKIPSTSLVSLVTNSQVCGKAKTAFANEFAASGSGLSAQVYVIAVGTAYAIVDPGYKYNGVDRGGPFAFIYFVDSKYMKLGILA